MSTRSTAWARELWLVSPRYDLTIIILSAALQVLGHGYVDHFRFLQVDEKITPRFGYPEAQAA